MIADPTRTLSLSTSDLFLSSFVWFHPVWCFGVQAGEAAQTETVSEENKSLIWTLVKQVRPGMDLSKVVLPTFILEPRSFLDKLSDYYYHADFLSEYEDSTLWLH